jgi:hypothetical protein
MTDPQLCVDELRKLAEAESGDPRKAAAKVVHTFVSTASKGEVRQLRVRLEDTLLAGKHTIVPIPYLDQHRRWLTVLEGACAEVRAR